MVYKRGYHKEWRDKHKDSWNARNADWRKINSSYAADYDAQHRDEKLSRMKKWHEKEKARKCLEKLLGKGVVIEMTPGVVREYRRRV